MSRIIRLSPSNRSALKNARSSQVTSLNNKAENNNNMKKIFQSVRLLLQLVLEVSVSGWELLTFFYELSPNIKVVLTSKQA